MRGAEVRVAWLAAGRCRLERARDEAIVAARAGMEECAAALAASAERLNEVRSISDVLGFYCTGYYFRSHLSSW